MDAGAGQVLREKEGETQLLVVGLHLPKRNVNQRTQIINNVLGLKEDLEVNGGIGGIDGVLLTGDFNMKPTALQKALYEQGSIGLKMVFTTDDPATSKSGLIDNMVYSEDLMQLAFKQVVKSVNYLSHKPIRARMSVQHDDASNDHDDEEEEEEEEEQEEVVEAVCPTCPISRGVPGKAVRLVSKGANKNLMVCLRCSADAARCRECTRILKPGGLCAECCVKWVSGEKIKLEP